LGNYIYAGSGTMMNNTLQDGTPYMLTASHVDASNSTVNAHFSSWIFYFNYETPTCPDTAVAPPSTQTISGATFKARSFYDSSIKAIVGDFLLLQLRTLVPVTYGSYLAGWDLSASAPSGTSICFHHPSGDSKKVSTTTHVYDNGDFNGGQPNSHWSVAPMNIGGFEEGSSGSGLFNSNGRLIGDLSGGYSSQEACTTVNSSGVEMSNYGEYSKIGLNWLYVYQQPSTPASRLKDWLDPNNSGATTLDAVAANFVKVNVTQVNTANNTVAVYPSPSTGIVNISGSFINTNTAKIEVFNVIGNKIWETETSALLNNYQIDLTGVAPGIYIVRISAGSSVITKKVLIAK
jgi:lysyl endopeptidase